MGICKQLMVGMAVIAVAGVPAGNASAEAEPDHYDFCDTYTDSDGTVYSFCQVGFAVTQEHTSPTGRTQYFKLDRYTYRVTIDGELWEQGSTTDRYQIHLGPDGLLSSYHTVAVNRYEFMGQLCTLSSNDTYANGAWRHESFTVSCS
jgi:hypothetical protein